MNSYIPKGYKAPPTSVRKIRDIANKLRRDLALGIDAIDMVYFMEFNLPRLYPNFALESSNDKTLHDNQFEAYFEPTGSVIVVREDVYLNATDPNNKSLRHQFTFAHEVGHFILHKGLNPVMPRGKFIHKPYEDTEWQADTFAAELLMPYDVVVGILRQANGLEAINKVMDHFNVSWDAARVRVDKVLKEMNR